MSKSELGLPLGYSKLHKYCDDLSAGDLDGKNRVIEGLLKKHKVRSVLDLTCGTGSQVFWLAKQGYEVTGSDFSPDMLSMAKEKAKSEKIDVKLIEGDMRSIRVGKFDAVITIFNAIGHLTKDDFEKAIGNIRENLRDGGIYVFDIFNLDSMTDDVVDDLAMDMERMVNGTKIHNVQYSEIDRKTGRLTSYDTFTIQEGSGEPKEFKGEFTLQIYTAEELRQMLSRNGFETIGQYGIDGEELLEYKTTNILTVAKKC